MLKPTFTLLARLRYGTTLAQRNAAASPTVEKLNKQKSRKLKSVDLERVKWPVIAERPKPLDLERIMAKIKASGAKLDARAVFN